MKEILPIEIETKELIEYFQIYLFTKKINNNHNADRYLFKVFNSSVLNFIYFFADIEHENNDMINFQIIRDSTKYEWNKIGSEKIDKNEVIDKSHRLYDYFNDALKDSNN